MTEPQDVVDDEVKLPWVFKWILKEHFWESVASQTISTLIAAVVIAFVAAFVGVAYSSETRFALLAGGIYGVFTLIFGVGSVRLASYIGTKTQKVTAVAAFLVEIVLIAVVIGLFGTSMQEVVASWVGYTGPLVTR